MARGLRVVTNGDPARLDAVAGPYLRARPAVHSVLLTNLARALVRADRPVELPADLWWWVETADGEVVAVLMHTPPHGAYLSDGPDDAVALLARELHARRPDLPGLGGPGLVAAVFARAWQDDGGAPAQVGMRQGLWAVERVVPPPAAPGRHRLATAGDADTLRQWASAFVREATPLGTRGGGPDVDHVTDRLAAGLLHVWDVDGAPVSMCAVTVAVADVVRVQIVYTPPSLRGKGFAAACVAAVSAEQLAHPGRTCMLYTDLANPTSNALYQRIGYRRIGEALDLVFPAARTATLDP
ncbi:GNAT family N-acetyltransferase [Angustibacter peucedani]